MGLSEAGNYVPLNSVKAIFFCSYFRNKIAFYQTLSWKQDIRAIHVYPWKFHLPSRISLLSPGVLMLLRLVDYMEEPLQPLHEENIYIKATSFFVYLLIVFYIFSSCRPNINPVLYTSYIHTHTVTGRYYLVYKLLFISI